MGTGFDPESTTADASSGDGAINNNNNNNEVGDFECNICFELAQDPIVTLCGHLFCWPCLYRWLHFHSQSHECPVCKALIQEDKLVPLYGRGKRSSDPRSRPIPDFDIPNRPSGQRPDTASPPPPAGPGADQSYFSNLGFGFLGGFMPMASARVGNMTVSAGFGGLFPSLLSFSMSHLNGFPANGMYGAAHGHVPGFPYGYPGSVHGVHHGHGLGHGYQNHQRGASQGQDTTLRNLLFVIGVLVILSVMWS